MLVYIKNHPSHAGKWIYEGFRRAWEHEGHTVKFYSSFSELTNLNEKFYLMAVDGTINNNMAIKALKKAEKTFLFVQPNSFPHPWGTHPNFVSGCPDDYIKKINLIDNCHLWTWVDDHKFHSKWKQINTLPLAFDSVSYQDMKGPNRMFDVCYIGGWANNGFDEKKQIMLKHFKEFKNTNLKCGFFINKNLSHEMENKIICNSGVAINIHDNYQRILGLDTNERTFKSLGLNGALVSDKVTQVERLFPGVEISETPEGMVESVMKMLDRADLDEFKQNNIKNVMENHTYINRVRELISL